MKIKMVKMGMDIDETRNYRIRGIIPTKDGKYLFVEIQQGNRPDIRYTSLSKNEYNLKYPNQEYIYLDAIFRVDMPKDYYHYYSSEFSSFERPYYELNYTNENIVDLLKSFNKDIEDIELVDDYYLDKFCEEKGFFKLYDERLEHTYAPVEIISSRFKMYGPTKVKFLYTCYSANGIKCCEEHEEILPFYNLIQKYGKETVKTLVDKYIAQLKKENLQEEYIKNASEVFKEVEKELNLNLDLENEYDDI